MSRAKSSTSYPASFWKLLTLVGEYKNEVRLDPKNFGVTAPSLRTTVQSFLASFRREAVGKSEFGPEAGHWARASKIIVRIVAGEVLVVHRDEDVLGLAMEKALAEMGGSVPAPVVVPRETSAPLPNLEKHYGRERSAERMGQVEELVGGVSASTPAVASELPGQSLIAVAPQSMMDMIMREEGLVTPEVQKYKRADGKKYPQEGDGEPSWGFNVDGEPKVNQFF